MKDLEKILYRMYIEEKKTIREIAKELNFRGHSRLFRIMRELEIPNISVGKSHKIREYKNLLRNIDLAREIYSLRQEGTPFRSIAKRVEIPFSTAYKLYNKYIKLMHGHERTVVERGPISKERSIRRKCLSCDHEFSTTSRFVRLCRTCRNLY